MLALCTNSGGVPVVPAFLEGWAPRAPWAIVHHDTAAGHVIGLGDPTLFNSTPGRWLPLADGWSVAPLRKPADFDPAATLRDQAWANLVPVVDQQGRTWHAPIIRAPAGQRAFRVAFGRDWLPALTPEQSRAEDVCRAAAEAILAGNNPPMSTACQWAAELLCVSNHLSVEVIQALALLDEMLVVATLAAACSLPLEKG